ncbi:hypothetical protein O7635_29765 [Asanoa sp. WMMD1127]|uniref:hypothetical protein n=1 Tax=Asanoa sp. WMMD1127 TaxID=3016107 RepID=UPI002417F90E|nr:hypothetical protein [Asanoa sp. WMMD1127]MDG4826056.1 hypothetical protein [Asanoa sp. WMMD1127]
MSTSDRLALVGILVAAAAIVTGMYATRRWGTRRRTITLDCVSTPLISSQLGAMGRDLLKVTYRDIEVMDPHLVQIRIRNVGPSDVASAHFDGETPLTVELSCRVLGVTNPGPVPAGVTSMGAQGHITFRPGLLRRNEEWVLGVLVEGNPRPEMVSSLIDTDVIVRAGGR